MNNPNDNKNYREVRQDSYSDRTGNTHTNVTRTTETVNNSGYQSGYVQGQTSERNYQEALVERDNDNATRGLLLGFLIAGLTALTVGAVWYFNRPEPVVDDTTTPSEVPAATQTPQPQTTIIERTREVPVPIPVPEQRTSPIPTPTTPNINITVPPQEPGARQTAPTSESSSSSSSTSTSSEQTDTTTTPTTSPSSTSPISPSPESQNQTDVTPNSSSASTENSNQD